MKPIQLLVMKLCTGPRSLIIDLPSEPEGSCLQASFLTVALNILGETGQAVVVLINGELCHCALLSPKNNLVLDSAGIKPLDQFQQYWLRLTDAKATFQQMTIADLIALCPPESGFFARALSSFEKVVVKHLPMTALAPAIVGYQVHNRYQEHWGDRPSFEILPLEMAHQDLIEARGAQPHAGWQMIAVLDGDIESPTFA
ncbi:hypothetical protein QO021_28640 (plasmid) [Pseudomonas amygdali pv. lachrymans]|uniref:hypothetical protein n=1 Tax=Pseudomonas amygdali TaxID=47877 RepID=UPI0006B9B519|nr:hypothetical protein [Pseudomonas amygdali]RMM39146.1 hypothetical protein ALQ79_200745 [Pseudomonas amygdali pv. lachrymans]WIO61528.1 hypothetical protein QO021_28640 [Pseudomonas amygdali pv. lachrymans]